MYLTVCPECQSSDVYEKLAERLRDELVAEKRKSIQS